MNDFTTRGLRLPGVLTVVFVVLKITGVIDWPWIWVFFPVRFEIAVIVLVCTVLYVMDHRDRKE